MQEHVRKRGWLWIFACLLILFAGIAIGSKTTEVQAASTYYNKLVWNDAHTERYYYNSSGQKVRSSWITVGRYRYYADSEGCLVLNDWIKSGSNYYYVNRNGAMYTDKHLKVDGKYYYFGSDGAMETGWVKDDGSWYYFASNGVRQKSWQTIDGRKYYFYSSGKMAVGWVKSGVGNYYYFEETETSRFKEGQMHTSWLEYNGRTYYMRPSTGRMVKDGTYSIGGKEYTFDEYGVLDGDGSVQDPESNPTREPGTAKTLKNFMLNALQPVGECLYVWGGGHSTSDATRKGVSSAWKSFYNSQSSSYNYGNVSDTSKGLDCSGYVGWSVYNVMNTSSGGTYLTGISNELGPMYAGKGWGSLISLSQLSRDDYTVQTGDIGGDVNHVWIILGQCEDKSAVILHCTPQAGVQIAGTPVPSTGNYGSQAVALAEKYMFRYPGYTKYDYHTSTSNYLRRGTYFRWDLNDGPLSDPDGYRNMTADEILRDLFGY